MQIFHLYLLSLTFSIVLGYETSDGVCYNVTCDTMSKPDCVITSNDEPKKMTINPVYCSNSKLFKTNDPLGKTKSCKLNA